MSTKHSGGTAAAELASRPPRSLKFIPARRAAVFAQNTLGSPPTTMKRSDRGSGGEIGELEVKEGRLWIGRGAVPDKAVHVVHIRGLSTCFLAQLVASKQSCVC